VLVSLYQCAELAVFPSLYEGYGLPVVESMACGAPTMAGDNSSLQEILPRDARFQPSDPGAIAEAIVRGLTDKPFRERLLALAGQRPPTWDVVADKAALVFEDLIRRSARYRPGWRRRPQFALIGLPAELADAVSAYANVDRYEPAANGNHNDAERRPAETTEAGAGAEDGPLPLSALRKLDPWRGGYDAIVGWPRGSGGQAAEVMEALTSEWPGRVVALFEQHGAGDEGTPFSVPGVATVLVPTEPANWEETARRVADAAHGRTW
jgi:Glycosyl transferases group 1